MPPPIKLLMNLVVMPYIIIRAILWVTIDTFSTAYVHMLKFDELKSKMNFHEEGMDPTRKAVTAHQDNAMHLVTEQRWGELAHLLEKLDQSRSSAPDGRRFVRPILENIYITTFRDIRKEMRGCEALSIDQIPFEKIDPFIQAARSNPGSYGLNALAAYMCLSIGWAMRGGDFVSFTPQTAFDNMERMFAFAGMFIDRLDPKELNSPMVAVVQYQKLAGFNCDLSDLQAAFQTCMQLDPHDLAMMSAHASYLLPRWYGNYDVLAETAQAVCAATRDELGATAYAAFYFTLLNDDEGAMSTVDTDLLERGLMDWINQSGDRQTTVNLVLGQLSKASERYLNQPAACRRKKDALKKLFFHLVREELDIVLVHRWTRNRRDVLYLAAEAFNKEIKNGEVVTIGKGRPKEQEETAETNT